MNHIDFTRDLLTYADRLFRVALSITGNAQEAEDIAEETLLRVWQKCQEGEEIRHIEVYLLTVCRRLALDRISLKSHSDISLEEHDIDAPDHVPTPADSLISADQVQWVRRIIGTLPEKQRTVLQLRDIEEKSVRETATILGITEDDVKVTHHRARRTLRDKLQHLENHGL